MVSLLGTYVDCRFILGVVSVLSIGLIGGGVMGKISVVGKRSVSGGFYLWDSHSLGSTVDRL